MSPNVANFLFETVNFGLLMAALAWLLLKPVKATLEAEKQRYVEAERAASEAKQLAEEQSQKARQALAHAEAEIDTRRREVLVAAENDAKKLRDEAEAERERKRTEVASSLRAERQAELEKLANAVGGVAANSVRHLLEAIDGPLLDQALVRRACRELGPVSSRSGPLVVDAARELDPESRRLLREALGRDFEEHTQSALGAGVRITTSLGQVDATAASIARQAATEMRGVAERAVRSAEAP